jgi:hypothetical protein
MTIPLQCRCGAMRGTVGVQVGVRAVCYCDDCQAYAHALGRSDVLDASGGTDIWQTQPATVKLSAGLEHLRCLRLSPKGMLRFHTGCCSTPIGNSMASSRLPFIGIVDAMMDHSAAPRDALLGPPHRIMGRFAKGGVPAGAPSRASVGFVTGLLGFMARGFISGGHQPTPFFDQSGAPVVIPRVLSVEERAALRGAS